MIIMVRRSKIFKVVALYITFCEEVTRLRQTVYDAYWDTTAHISSYQKSLYEQRHAFYFRKVHEWLDYIDVSCSVQALSTVSLAPP